jgi:hypothetical protein
LPDGRAGVPEGEKVLIAQPKVIPDKLLENLAEVFKSVEGIDEAFFAQMYFASRPDSPHIMIQLKFREGFRGDLAPFDSSIREAIAGTVDPSVPIDFSLVTDKPYEATRRFYKRADS